MGFFSKIFGGGKKSDSKEIKTVSGEQPAVSEEKAPAVPSVSPEPVPEEERVPEPELKDDAEALAPAAGGHKPTVFGMPAPPVVSGSVAVDAGEVVIGETASGEAVIDAPVEKPVQETAKEAPPAEVAGELVVGEAVMESVLEAPASGAEETAKAASAAETAENAENMEAAEAEEIEAAAPLPASEAGARTTSGSRPAVVEDDLAEGNLELFPKAEKRDLRSSIDCASCRRRLPVPYVGYPARITCPFCLNVNEYNL